MAFTSGRGMSDSPSSLAAAGAPGGSTPDVDQPDVDEPKLDLGPGVATTTFTPGRFANAIERTNNARHALQVIREETTSSFVMNLEPDGSATVCRGWQYLFFNDGPQVHTSEQLREQLGYRGRWKQAGEFVLVDLTLDDSVCARVGQYTQLVPNHLPEWHLRCLSVVPRDHPALVTPALACQLINVQSEFGEDDPHIVDGILPDRWLVLGAGNGLKINVAATSVSGDEAPVIRVTSSTKPIRTDAWEHPF